MINITQKDIEFLYGKIKKKAFKEFHRGKLEQSLKDISVAARIAYNSNFIYKDDDLENLLSEISHQILPQQVHSIDNSNKYVFIDAFGRPNRGLTQQYLRALMALDVEFLYISEDALPIRQIIFDEVRNSSKGTLCLVDKRKEIDRIKFVYAQIEKFQPSVILGHIVPWDVLATTVLYAFPYCKRYNINLTDHAFWLGTGCFDYTLEFRDYGCTVSYEKRGFSRSQILLNPYYPIIDKTDFCGFPDKIKGKTVLFSGGAYYKIYGENNAFLKMMRRILDENPTAILLFAGWGDEKPIKNFIKENDLEERLILLGNRKDINEVFAHCDIYLGTYPMGGGLMTQYAAYNSKPVVAYAKDVSAANKIEDLVFSTQENSVILTYTDIEEYFTEIKQLINDVVYRKRKGKILKNALNTKEQFDRQFKYYVEEKANSSFCLLSIDYEGKMQWYLKLINITPWNLGVILARVYSVKSILFSCKIMLRTIPKIIEKVIKTI